MNEPKYTKGPWYWANFGDSEVLLSGVAHRPVVLIAGGKEMKTAVDGILVPITSDNPNARLIAAAPELLNELKMACGYLQLNVDLRTHKGAREHVEKWSEIIAKAEGK